MYRRPLNQCSQWYPNKNSRRKLANIEKSLRVLDLSKIKFYWYTYIKRINYSSQLYQWEIDIDLVASGKVISVIASLNNWEIFIQFEKFWFPDLHQLIKIEIEYVYWSLTVILFFVQSSN